MGEEAAVGEEEEPVAEGPAEATTGVAAGTEVPGRGWREVAAPWRRKRAGRLCGRREEGGS